MDGAEAESGGRIAEKATGSHESSGSGGSWESIIENIVLKLETVSSHFGYTEEYVLEHTPEWLERKYWQALKEKFDDSQAKVIEGFKSLALLVDSIFNKGANYNELIYGSFEEAMMMKDVQKQTETKFIQGQWWMANEQKTKSPH